MNEQLNQLVDKLKSVQNILVTVSKNPSVDQLAAAIGLTAGLNNAGKRATAVYSGETPSTIEFLKPDETLEKDTNSLRDFIIALDKSKADKLRYKVEDDVVRIYVTPYKTSISEEDLEFSQGDFNIEAVLALGVRNQEDLDEAIRAHGRIFHSATVISVDIGEGSDVGTMNWFDSSASSLSEMSADLLGKLDSKSFDSQVSTALLTGIVSATDRFSNEKTSPRTMSASAALMATGANQQLISAELNVIADEQTEENVSNEDETTLNLQEYQKPEEQAEKPELESDSELKPEPESADVAPEKGDQAQDESADKSNDEDEDKQSESDGEDEPKEDKSAEITVDEEGHLRLVEELEAEKVAGPKKELKLPEPADVNDQKDTENVENSSEEQKNDTDFLASPSEPAPRPDQESDSKSEQPIQPPAFNAQAPALTPAPSLTPPPSVDPSNLMPTSGPAPVSPPSMSLQPPSNSPNRLVMPKAVAPSPPAPLAPPSPPAFTPSPTGPAPQAPANPFMPPANPSNTPSPEGPSMVKANESPQPLDDARDAVNAAFEDASAGQEPSPGQGSTLSHKAPTLTPPPQPNIGSMPPMPPLPNVPEPTLGPPPTGFVPPKPTAPPPPPVVGGVPSLPQVPAPNPGASSLVPPVPSGNVVSPTRPMPQPVAGGSMAPPPMAPPIPPPVLPQ